MSDPGEGRAATPRIVSLSGLDGAGKTTQIDRLLRRRAEAGRRVLNLVGTPMGKFYDSIGDLRKVSESTRGHDLIATRFYALSPRTLALKTRICTSKVLDHPQENRRFIVELTVSAAQDALRWHEIVVMPAFERGAVVLFDRYVYDELAYRHLYGIAVSDVEGLYQSIPDTDQRIFLDASIPKLLQRNAGRPDANTELLSRPDHLRRLRDNFKMLSQRRGLVIVNADDDESVVAARIEHHLVAMV